ncbi:MAG: alcohol dehydrogenase catalytic domain-containing protein, partial [Dehalococcoidia bacterium]|nr:alcohol dehydrogenase catalytic domain-containing protein [Dehalococcoidia bacterium]
MLAAGKAKPGPGIDIFEHPEPKITRGDEVLLEVAACGICGSDLHTYRWRADEISQIKRNMRLPIVLGHEVAGTILETGRDVVGFRVGDRVMCETSAGCGACFYCRLGRPNLCDKRHEYTLGMSIDGGYARYTVIRANCLFRIPEGVSFVEAAVMEPFAMVVHAVGRSHLKAGDHVVIMGPGPMGLLGAMVAKASGAATVMVAGLPLDRERLNVASQIGAEAVEINGDNLRERVLKSTEGRGADIVFDIAGGSAALNSAVDVVRKGGEIIMVGLGGPGQFEPKTVVTKELNIVGALSRLPSDWDRASALVSSGSVDLKPIITHTLPLRSAKEAFE